MHKIYADVIIENVMYIKMLELVTLVRKHEP